MWSEVKRILNWEGGGPPNQLFYEGRMLTKPAAVASAINNFFIKKVKNIIGGIPHVDMDPLAKLQERMAARQCRLTLRPVTEAEVLQQIKGIKSTPATGVDFIDNCSLKLVAEEITPALAHIINLSIATSTFPTIYKQSKVTPLLKKNTLDPIMPASYRPVNQLVSLSKIWRGASLASWWSTWRRTACYTLTSTADEPGTALPPHSYRCTTNGWRI